MFQSLTLVLPFVALLISQPTECSIESFGYEETSFELLHPFSAIVSGRVVITGTPIGHNGSVFAFSANVSSSSQFYFQIYRPENTANGSIAYRLTMSLGVIPTALGKWEDFYVESFLGKQCVFVRPGDRLGLHFPTVPPPVVYGSRLKAVTPGVELSDVSIDSFNSSMNPGAILYMNTGPTGQVWTFLAVGIINTNVTAPDADTTLANCTRGVMIPGSNLSPATVTTTTYIPPTGIPGSKGFTGQQGVTGQQGDTGNTGPQGVKGATGNTGNTGSVGWTGAVGDAGSMGENSTEQGTIGENGTTGDTGPMGLMGQTGIPGPAGSMGINLTIILNGPNTGELLSDVFWQKDTCMQGVYIWLAIASFVALVGLLFLVADCCLAGQSKSDM